ASPLAQGRGRAAHEPRLSSRRAAFPASHAGPRARQRRPLQSAAPEAGKATPPRCPAGLQADPRSVRNSRPHRRGHAVRPWQKAATQKMKIWMEHADPERFFQSRQARSFASMAVLSNLAAPAAAQEIEISPGIGSPDMLME